jgi:hypothetical protein
VVPLRPYLVRERSPLAVALLCAATCGLYALWWRYLTTHELQRATGDGRLNAFRDLTLSLATCGLWGIYTDYRNARCAHAVLTACGVRRESRAWLVVALGAVGLGLVASYILQRELNAVARARLLASGA